MTVHPFIDRLRGVDPAIRVGRVRRILSTFIEADGPSAPLGSLCAVESRDGGPTLAASIVGVHRDHIVLAPFEDTGRTFSGARVEALAEADAVPVGDAFLGRAVDALGCPIDDGPAIRNPRYVPLQLSPIAPLDRATPDRMLETGVRAIDGLLTLGLGQRVGVFAAAGVGKTSLMTQLARQVEADRCVVCLVGERGREVEALWSSRLSPATRARTTLIAATSDQTAAMRVRAGSYALALADHWRREGHQVLLLLDSVTRLAMALREIGLAAGEPPTVRAYTPGVFAALPRLVEGCGALKSGGSISAVMTVLSETDDVDDPVSETMKSLLDGHIVLSRSLAEQGHHPAIDVPRSVSRLAGGLMTSPHRTAATRAVGLLSTYETSRTLIEAGVYAAGSNPEIDASITHRPALATFLRQDADDRSPLATTVAALQTAAEG